MSAEIMFYQICAGVLLITCIMLCWAWTGVKDENDRLKRALRDILDMMRQIKVNDVLKRHHLLHLNKKGNKK